jgi:hypothetical protein
MQRSAAWGRFNGWRQFRDARIGEHASERSQAHQPAHGGIPAGVRWQREPEDEFVSRSLRTA